MTKTTYKITESDLKNMIKEALNESIASGEIDEGFFDYLKGMGKAAGNKMGSAGRQMGNSIKNAATAVGDKIGKAGNAVVGAAKQAGDKIQKTAQDIHTAGKKASMTGDQQKVANQLVAWYNKGVFGNSRQAKSQISALINAMKNTYSAQYGEESAVQKNW
jgi:hypothetical protein